MINGSNKGHIRRLKRIPASQQKSDHISISSHNGWGVALLSTFCENHKWFTFQGFGSSEWKLPSSRLLPQVPEFLDLWSRKSTCNTRKNEFAMPNFAIDWKTMKQVVNIKVILASMVDREDKALSSSERLSETPWGGSFSRSLISFCIRRFNLAAWAIL